MNWDFEINIDMSKVFVPMTMENLVKMLNDKEESRLQKLYEEWKEKHAKAKGEEHNHNSSSGGGMGFGGLSSGMSSIKNTIK